MYQARDSGTLKILGPISAECLLHFCLVAMVLVASYIRLLAEDTNLIALRVAADKGDLKAQYELARRYGLSDPAKSFKYMRMAAERGHAKAQTDLGTYYGRGIGVATNAVAAAQWYHKAASQGELFGEYCWGACLLSGYGAATNDESEGIKWWVDAGEKGQADSQLGLGLLFMNRGIINDPGLVDYTEASTWLQSAADQDSETAMINLGYLYENGMGAVLNYDRAVKWYRMAAERNNGRAQVNLGRMYERGFGVPMDPVNAFKWYILSSQNGDLIGRSKYKEFSLRHSLKHDQIINARKMASDFLAAHHLPPISDISTNSAGTNVIPNQTPFRP